MHKCPLCGEICYCNGEFPRISAPENCPHVCNKADPDDEKEVAYYSPDEWQTLMDGE